MKFGNSMVAALLRSPLHGVLSGSTDLVRYEGRRSGREITTPTQYARQGDDLVILVGQPDTKSWWRNFVGERDIDILVAGRWRPMTARAVVGADDPATASPLLETYLERFPRAARSLGGDDPDQLVDRAVLVWARPR